MLSTSGRKCIRIAKSGMLWSTILGIKILIIIMRELEDRFKSQCEEARVHHDYHLIIQPTKLRKAADVEDSETWCGGLWVINAEV
jgi:hypothetical protein